MDVICDGTATCNVDCNETEGYWCPNQFSDSSNGLKFERLDVDTIYDPFWLSNNYNRYDNKFDIISYYNDSCAVSCVDSYNNNCSIIDDSVNGNYTVTEIENNAQNPNGNALCALGFVNVDDANLDINVTGYDIISPGTKYISNVWSGVNYDWIEYIFFYNDRCVVLIVFLILLVLVLFFLF